MVSFIQLFEAAFLWSVFALEQAFSKHFLWKVSLKILNSGIILKTFTHVLHIIVLARVTDE